MNALPMPRLDESLEAPGVARASGVERRCFVERVGSALDQARRGGHRAALLLVGIDTPYNDVGSLEPPAVLSLAARAGERLARAGGAGTETAQLRHDQFALLMPRMRHGAQVREAATRMLGSMRFPFRASIGIATFPTDGASPGALIACAAAALASARREGRHGYRFYVPFFAATSAASSAPDL